ncbi:MAG: glycosyltransferase [Ignavibacteriae bacterium]|nr:glycosyltransferase [Ignavibacteriota bacterium]NOH00046.1 glycosyltransferase [Ignavibacteriota bacterium]
MKNNKRLLIYGPHPLANGGVETHMKRFLNLLNKDKELDFQFYHYYAHREKINFKYLTHWQIFFKGIKHEYDILLVHQFQSWRFHLLVSILSSIFGVKTIIYYHNNRFRDFYLAVRPALRIFTRLYFTFSKLVISVNPNTDFMFIPSKKIKNIPAFIPPTEDELKKENLPKEILRFRSRFNRVIASNAAKLKFYKGEDLYGFDLSIELMKLLKKNNNEFDVGLILVVPDTANINYFNSLINLVDKYSLNDNILFITYNISFSALIAISDLFVRPTNTDGDALSIRESLYLNIPVVASNAVSRPDGCILFENRSLNDYYNIVNKTLLHLDKYKNEIKKIGYLNYYREIISLIKKL